MKWVSSLVVVWLASASAMMLDGTYDPDTHDVYASGYPDAPVRNSTVDFVGAERDLTPVTWASDKPVKSFLQLSPLHYLLANHFKAAVTVQAFGADSQVTTRTPAKTENTDLGVQLFDKDRNPLPTLDIGLGTLQNPFPAAALPSRTPILDLHVTSDADSPSAYVGIPIHVFGRDPDITGSPRLAASTISSVNISGDEHVMTFSRSPVELQGQDSGSPTLAPWVNPNGEPVYTVVGNHAAIDTENGFNIDNFVAGRAVILKLNEFTTDDGFSLRIVGPPGLEWEGTSNTSITSGQSWAGPSSPPAADQYAVFDGATAGSSRSVNLNASFLIRGLFFPSTGSSSLGFSFSGAGSLEVGRGGITNYGTSVQTFTAPVRLMHHQFWLIGNGGIHLQDLQLQSYLLEVSGPVTVDGAVTGSGGLAFSGGESLLTGTGTQTGSNWVHQGRLTVNGDFSNTGLWTVAPLSTLQGSGKTGTLHISGALSPGSVAPGILTAGQLTGSPGSVFRFQITSETLPQFDTPAASGQDLLRLSHSTSPFGADLPSDARLEFYLDTVNAPQVGFTASAGFYTDMQTDFLPRLSSAALQVYVPDPNGEVTFESQPYSLYTGEGEWVLDTVAQSADFGEGSVQGRISRLRLLPPPGTYERWTVETFPENIPASDRDPDDINNPAGIANRYAYAFQLDPLNPAPTQLPYAQTAAEMLEVYFRRRRNATDLIYQPQSVFTLGGTWQDEALVPVTVTEDVDGDGAVDLVKVQRPVASGETQVFLRISTPFQP